tara:strand:+ start:92 stop:478 length:387 start_codon:yes stop_codon:yes gene_type:complete
MKISKSKKVREAIVAALDAEMAIAELEPLGLSVRTIAGLEDKLGVVYLEDLLKKTLEEVKAVRNLGDSAVAEIETALNDLPKLTTHRQKKHRKNVMPLINKAESLRDYQAVAAKDEDKKYDGAGREIE